MFKTYVYFGKIVLFKHVINQNVCGPAKQLVYECVICYCMLCCIIIHLQLPSYPLKGSFGIISVNTIMLALFAQYIIFRGWIK